MALYGLILPDANSISAVKTICSVLRYVNTLEQENRYIQDRHKLTVSACTMKSSGEWKP